MKILIFTASTGGGHKRAAAALDAKIKALDANNEVKVVDALKAIGKVYDKTVCGGYHFMATKIPKVYGVCYKVTDRKTIVYDAVMKSNTAMSNKLLSIIDEFNPDVIIMCHPFITTMVSRLRRKGKISAKAISLITDYDAHRTYFVPNIDAYVLAEPQMAEKLVNEYDVDKNIKVMNITPDAGPDIKFYDYNDTIYTLHDNNTDNKINDSYDMYLKANYSLSDYLKWEYSTEFLGKKIDYDFMSNYVYVKDNILYSKNYGNEKYPTTEKVSGNYEGEKVIRIYNERIVKTDKAFYELMSYFDTDLNKTVTTTVKINKLTKYYDEVLTFTYKYVVLKDLTLIPINDIMENRVREYQYDYFLSGFNYMSEVRYEE